MLYFVFRRQCMEIFFKVVLVIVGKFEYFGNTVCATYIYAGNVIINSRKINIICLTFERKIFGKLVTFQ